MNVSPATRIALICLLVWGLSPVSRAEGPALTAEERATLRGALADVTAIRKLAADGFRCPLPDDELVDLARAAESIHAVHRPALFTEDGWDRPFKTWCNESSWMLVSFGADGRPGGLYPEVDDFAGLGDDVVFVDGRFVAGPEPLSSAIHLTLQLQTMKDLRSVGTTFEAFAIDNERYPGEPSPAVQDVARVQPLVQPVYIREFPFVDGWGHAFRFWTDGQSYRIFSPGRDGEADADYTLTPGSGEFDAYDFDRDIVFGNGMFEQWPVQDDDDGA